MDSDTLLTSLLGGLWSGLAFILALSIIVSVHEYGHYIIGRLSGIHAEVFSVGFGKTLVARVDRHGTRWQIAAIPLGGYVKFLGDANASSANPDEATLSRLSPAERRHTMHGAPLWARAATVLAGPAFNVLLTIVVFMGMLSYWGVIQDEDAPVVGSLRNVPGFEQTLLPGDRILSVAGTETPDVASFFKLIADLPATASVEYTVQRGDQVVALNGPYPLAPVAGSIMSKSAAMDAGMQAGDVILQAGGQAVLSFDQLPQIVAASNGAPVPLTIWRDGKTFEISLTPRRRDLPAEGGGFETRWLIGVTNATVVDLATLRPGPLETVQLALAQTWRVTKSSVEGILAIVKGQISSCNVSGAITMAVVVGDAAKAGLEAFLGTLAVLSLGIGIMNLFPVPVLDGGHLVFHAWEAITGKPPSPGALARMTMVGLALVLGLMVYALRNDLVCT